jgi:Subtilase family
VTEQPLGRRFGPGDPRTAEQKLVDLRRAQRQADSVRRVSNDLALSQRHLDVVKARRAGQRGIRQIGEIPDKHGTTTLATESELLIRSEALPAVASFLRSSGVDPAGGEAVLRGRVTKLAAPGLGLDALAQIAATLRLRGIPISAHHITPMGVFWKALTGPENSEGPAPKWAGGKPGGRSGVRVAVIDTGVWEGKRKDEWLTGLQRRDNTEDLYQDRSRKLLNSSAGHGSFCAGIVRQVAPQVDLVVYKVLDSDGINDEVSIAEAMVNAASEGLREKKHVVISLSLGTETADDERPIALGAALDIIDELQSDRKANRAGKEVLVVAAAGNYGEDRPCYPAAFPSVVAVAGLTQNLEPAQWSSRGSWVDVSTIAEGVRSTFVPGVESPEFDPDPDEFPDGAWALWTGTSFAAPQVAGAISVLAHESGSTLTEARRTLLRGRSEIPLYGKVVEILPAI